MFACYLDDSGKDQRVITLAGYVAHIDAWREFEAASDELFSRYDVPVFHAKEFKATQDVFKGWTRIKKQTFTREWFDIAAPKLDMGISFSARVQTYRSRQEELGRNQTMSAYGCCFSAIVIKLTRDKKIAPQIAKEGISFLVESGNSNNNEIAKWFHKVSKFPAFMGALKSISFVDKTSSRAIQLADFYAFYSRRDAVQHDRFDGNILLPIDPIYDHMRQRLYNFRYVISNPYAGDGRPVGGYADFVFPAEQSS